jgi:hypothetical protein
MRWRIPVERRQAWAATSGSAGTGMIVFAADHLKWDLPPPVSWAALVLGVCLGILSVYLWTHIAIGTFKRKGAVQALPEPTNTSRDWFDGIKPIKFRSESAFYWWSNQFLWMLAICGVAAAFDLSLLYLRHHHYLYVFQLHTFSL